jgi:23S rRNA pseudouridine1911/1915/1917 synthase
VIQFLTRRTFLGNNSRTATFAECWFSETDFCSPALRKWLGSAPSRFFDTIIPMGAQHPKSKPRRSRSGPSRLPLGLGIVFEDEDVMVVEKPPGVLTMGTASERTRTAYAVVTEHVRGRNPRSPSRVFIVHRLDRETSGLLVFARTPFAKHRLQDSWPETRKQYLAVVHGSVSPDAGTLSSRLAENAAYDVYVTSDPAKGKLAHTAYRVLMRSRRYSLLEIDLLTGRKHQIRVHLAGIGHPVVGDRRYGPPDRAHKQLALHAWSLAFRHPVSGEELTFRTPVPRRLTTLVRPGNRIPPGLTSEDR